MERAISRRSCLIMSALSRLNRRLSRAVGTLNEGAAVRPYPDHRSSLFLGHAPGPFVAREALSIEIAEPDDRAVLPHLQQQVHAFAEQEFGNGVLLDHDAIRLSLANDARFDPRLHRRPTGRTGCESRGATHVLTAFLSVFWWKCVIGEAARPSDCGVLPAPRIFPDPPHPALTPRRLRYNLTA